MKFIIPFKDEKLSYALMTIIFSIFTGAMSFLVLGLIGFFLTEIIVISFMIYMLMKGGKKKYEYEEYY